MSQEKELSIILPDGNPQGIKLVSFAQKGRMSGTPPPIRCALIPRDNIRDLQKHRCLKGLETPCLYFLLGRKDGIDGAMDVYVGEAENFVDRVPGHNAKSFWQSALVFYVENKSINKAHVKFLEHHSIKELHDVGRQTLNKVEPTEPILWEGEKQECLAFFDNVKFFVKFLSSFKVSPLFDAPVDEGTAHPAIEQPKVNPYKTVEDTKPVGEGYLFYLSYPSKGVSARARSFYDGKKTCVLAGSKVVKDVKPSYEKVKGGKSPAERLSWLRDNAIDRGDYFELTQDKEFSSPSSAAMFCMGFSANGSIYWVKEDDGRTWGDVNASLANKEMVSPTIEPPRVESYKTGEDIKLVGAGYLFRLSYPSKGVSARAKSFYDGKKTCVLAKSQVVKEAKSSYEAVRGKGSAIKRLKWLLENADDKGGYFELRQEKEFGSPSAAAVFCMGYSVNGKNYWIREEDGKTWGEVSFDES